MLSKWTGFGAFTELEQEMHTLLDHFGGRPWLEGFGWRPDMDIHRDGSTLVVDVDLPGIDPLRDLEIVVARSVLRIAGEKRGPRHVEDSDRLVQERRCGHFHRSVILPDGVDPDLIDANYDNGTLTVRVPVPDTSDTTDRSLRIPVRTAAYHEA